MAKGKKDQTTGNGAAVPETAAPAAEPTKAREIPSISVIAREDWSGRTTTTDKRLPDKSAKFSITVPVPETDEDMQAVYGVSLADVIEKGVIQLWYGARDVDNAIKEKFAAGVAADSDEFTAYVAQFAAGQRFEAKPRVSQAKEVKALKSELASAGMSIAEAIALMKQLKEAGQIG